jgi:hypothetical protein
MAVNYVNNAEFLRLIRLYHEEKKTNPSVRIPEAVRSIFNIDG